MTRRTREFLTKLKDLLTEYDADISLGWDAGSDWHGITGERMEVEVSDKKFVVDYETYINPHNIGIALKRR